VHPKVIIPTDFKTVNIDYFKSLFLNLSQIKEHYTGAAALLSSFMLVVGILSGLQFSKLYQSAVLM
jgi:hypothetical protein